MNNHIAQLNWYDGMFIQPHHFQYNDHRINNLFYLNIKKNPYWWGISEEIEYTLEQSTCSFHLEKLELFHSNGFYIKIPPGNTDRCHGSFDSYKDESKIAVYIGITKKASTIPQKNDNSTTLNSNANETMYTINEIGFRDENTENDEEKIKVNYWNIKLFFKNDDPTISKNYYLFKIGEIENINSIYKFNSNFIPPNIKITSSSLLYQEIKELVDQLKTNRTQNIIKCNDLVNTNNKEISFYTISRLYSELNATNVLESLIQPESKTHPYHLYIELIRLNSALSICFPENNNHNKKYDHNDLYNVLIPLIRNILHMLKDPLEKIEIEDKHKCLDMKNYNEKDNSAYFEIQSDWLKKDFPFFLRIKANDKLDADDIIKKIKLGSSHILKNVNHLKSPGFKLKYEETPPADVDADRSLFYYEINFDHNYNALSPKKKKEIENYIASLDDHKNEIESEISLVHYYQMFKTSKLDILNIPSNDFKERIKLCVIFSDLVNNV